MKQKIKKEPHVKQKSKKVNMQSHKQLRTAGVDIMVETAASCTQNSTGRQADQKEKLHSERPEEF